MGIPVWLLARDFEPRGNSLYTLRLASRLPEYGFEPLIVCSNASHIPPRLRAALPIEELPLLSNAFLRSWVIRRFIASRGDRLPALIHAQRRVFDTLAMEFVERLQRPYLITVHDILPPGQTITVHRSWLRGVVAVSPSVERDLVHHTSLTADDVTMIPSGVEMPAESSPDAPPAKCIPVVGMASVLTPVKGAMYFLMAAEQILASGHDVEFLVAGTGPEEETLRRATRHLDIANRVTFVGHAMDFEKILASIDVFVVPSLEEGLGTIMLEAMAMGKPVVATKVGGMADFFEDGEHALLVAKAHHVALAEKIQYLLDNPRRARKLAAAGQQFVRREFAVDRMAAETARLYRKALDLEAATAGVGAEGSDGTSVD